MRQLFKQPSIILASISGILLIIDAVFRLVCDGQPPAWVGITFGLFGILFAILAILAVIIQGLVQCFSKIAKWAKIDSWGHFIPMLVFVMVFSVGVLLAFAVLVKWKYPSLQSRGEFGDSFGALNTFFSTAAFLALLVSIAMQRRQMMDERERDNIEQDQKRRASWPAVVVANQKGCIYLYGATNKGNPILSLQFTIVLRNVSKNPILNVFPRILFERFDSKHDFIEAKTGGSICIDSGEGYSFDFQFTYAISDTSDIDKAVKFLQCDRHLICVTSFATAQRLYYSTSQMSVINLTLLSDIRKELQTFFNWAHDSRSRGNMCNKRYLGHVFPYEYSFSVLPLTCDLKEITFEEFKTAVADGIAR